MTIPYYQTYGSGHRQTLILLHSGGMHGGEWQPQIAALSNRYRLLIPDLPGHGNTPLPDDRLTISKLADAVLAMMDDAGIVQAHICGSSMGAAAAMHLTLKHSARFDKAIYYRIAYRKTAGAHQQTQNMADPDYWRQYGLHNWLAKIHAPQGGPDAWQRVIARVSEALDPDTTEHNHCLEDFQHSPHHTLIITGDRDPVSPLEDAIALYRAIPAAGLWILPFAGHITASNTWRSSAFAEEIIRFLGSKPDNKAD